MRLLLAILAAWKRHRKTQYEAQAEYHRVKAATYERCVPDNGEKVSGYLIMAIANNKASEAKYRSLAKSVVLTAILAVGLSGCDNSDAKSYSYGTSLESISDSMHDIACVLKRYDREKLGHQWNYNYTCDGQSTEGWGNAH